LARQSIDNAIQMLITTNMLSIEVLSQNSFHIQTDSLINNFINQTLQDIRRRQSFMIDTIRSNQFMNIAATTWAYSRTNAEENFVLATIPVSSYTNNCICALSLESCSRPLYISYYSNETTLPGVVSGCLPINGLRLSTLQCFYDSECLNNLLKALPDDYNTFNYTPQLLNASLSSIFTPTTPLSILIDELFVERWIRNRNYSNYFTSCAPQSCSYTYVQRNDVLYMITTILGLYGGLTLVLRFIIWHGLYIIRMKIRPFFLRRHLSTVHVIQTEVAPTAID